MMSKDGHNPEVIKLVDFLVENTHAPLLKWGSQQWLGVREFVGMPAKTFILSLMYHFEINVSLKKSQVLEMSC